MSDHLKACIHQSTYYIGHAMSCLETFRGNGTTRRGKKKARNQHGLVRVASAVKGQEGRDHFEQTTTE